MTYASNLLTLPFSPQKKNKKQGQTYLWWGDVFVHERSPGCFPLIFVVCLGTPSGALPLVLPREVAGFMRDTLLPRKPVTEGLEGVEFFGLKLDLLGEMATLCVVVRRAWCQPVPRVPQHVTHERRRLVNSPFVFFILLRLSVLITRRNTSVDGIGQGEP